MCPVSIFMCFFRIVKKKKIRVFELNKILFKDRRNICNVISFQSISLTGSIEILIPLSNKNPRPCELFIPTTFLSIWHLFIEEAGQANKDLEAWSSFKKFFWSVDTVGISDLLPPVLKPGPFGIFYART